MLNFIKVQCKMDNIFMISENSRISNLHRLMLYLSDKTDLNRNDKYVALSHLSIDYSSKNEKKLYKKSKNQIVSSTMKW